MNEVTGNPPMEVSDTASAAEQTAAATALVSALTARGLVAKVPRLGVVLAINPAGEPEGGDPRSRVMSPGLSQEVRCRLHPSERLLWWYWAWAGPTRGSAPELEPLCRATDTDQAADRIAKVLEVPFLDTPSQGVLRDDG